LSLNETIGLNQGRSPSLFSSGFRSGRLLFPLPDIHPGSHPKLAEGRVVHV
jgi:hypothetical protein